MDLRERNQIVDTGAFGVVAVPCVSTRTNLSRTALTLRHVYGLPHRQAEGFLHSLLQPVELTWTEFDSHDSFPRARMRGITEQLLLCPYGPSIQPSTATASQSSGRGLAAVKYGKQGKRGWEKRYFGVNGAGEITAHAVADVHIDDAKTGLDLI